MRIRSFAAWAAAGFVVLLLIDQVVELGSIWRVGFMAVCGGAGAAWVNSRASSRADGG